MSCRECLEVGRLLWQVTRGHRLRPWRSDYLRWRIETYSGMQAEQVGPGRFLAFAWRERQRLYRYLLWAAAMRTGGAAPVRPPRPPGGP